MTILENLGTELSALESGALSPDEQGIFEIHLLDTVLATLLGPSLGEGRDILALRDSSKSKIPVLTDTALDSVAINCALTRMTEVDNIHLASGVTPAAIVIPAALTMAHHLGVTSSTTLAGAVLAGLEAMTRLGAAVDGQNIVYKGIWPTYLTAPFATAAVTSRLLELNSTQTAHALAIALTAMPGRMGQPGTEKASRWLMAGMAARAGCFAALSARDGFTGDLGLFDGEWMTTAHGLETNVDVLAKGFGKSVVNGLSIKPYCSAKQMLAAIAAFEEVIGRGVHPDDIEILEISVPENYAKMIDHGVVAGNRLSSVTSAGYQLGLAAYHREGLFDARREDYVLTDEITALMKKATVTVDRGLVQYLPGNWPARVTVQTTTQRETATVIDAPGDPNAPFSRDRMIEKFHAFADKDTGADQADAWIKTVGAALSDDRALPALLERYTSITGN